MVYFTTLYIACSCPMYTLTTNGMHGTRGIYDECEGCYYQMPLLLMMTKPMPQCIILSALYEKTTKCSSVLSLGSTIPCM